MKRFLVLFFGVLWAMVLCIAGPAYAGRPFSTTDASVAGKGVAHMEMSAEYARQHNRDRKYVFLFVPQYGMTEHLELSAEFPYDFTRTADGDNVDGLEDVSLVLKTLIIEERDDTPALLIKTVVKLDNGDEGNGLGSGDEDVGFVAAATKGIGPLTIHANFGYTFVGKGYDHSFKNYIMYGVAGEYLLSEKTSLMAELYGESNSHFDWVAFKHHALQGLLGLTHQLAERIMVDAGVIVGLSHDTPDYGLTAGVSIKF